ncbi:hypothetical protein ITJ44_09010 [Clavibacter sp. VKM Ac-2873]|uniref:hypothetical protein n=1 Tax=Clavibacter sp. VKM Ac-2873 TaxID=2783813 RepID=UPI00188C6A80|nr:hypothetical protein [Clavibacter sp. VKM Ac-2873]MBF4618209.1 hypothetical protein [Clavibacter sp. VKM Ac-2873]
MSTPATPARTRTLLIAIAALLALILVGGGIAVATGAFSGGGAPVAAPTGDAVAATEADTSTSAPALPDGAASVCGLPGYEETSSLTTAPKAQWEIIGTTAVPQDTTTTGPGEIEDGGRFTTCFAHTAAGALFASVNFLASGTDTRNFPRIYELLADGDAKDLARSAGPTAKAPDASDGSRVQVAGFKIDRYSADEVTVDLALSYSTDSPQLASMPVVLRWEHGDWKIVFGKDGPPIKPSSLTSLGGYIPFAGV